MTKKETKMKCPVCKKKAIDKYKPFCSKRCADVDLHRWLGGHYRIETEEETDTDEGQQSLE